MMYRAVDVFGFAGGFTLGVVQRGFELVGKRELPGGFGVANCEQNRHLLGGGWETQARQPETWTPLKADLVFGNPPCSGFSVMTSKKHRGIDASVNECMWQLVHYASRCDPTIVVFESVRPAYRNGRSLMVTLRAELEERTGHRYDLHHVMHNAIELGGAGNRPRYFWVASRVPFGVDFPRLHRQPSLNEVIGDLEGLPVTWHHQPYRRPPTWWSASRRSETGVTDGHVVQSTPYTQRALDLLQMLSEDGGWPPGRGVADVARLCYERFGRLPKSWDQLAPRFIANDFHMGFTTAVRWDGRAPTRVITGSALIMVIHPNETRTITHREAARIMGFPDDWAILPLRGASGLHATWGKGITVDCGRWITGWVRAALDGDPGPRRGTLVGEREWLIEAKMKTPRR